MRYFFDTEFWEDGRSVRPISIGIKAADGRELYLEYIFSWREVESAAASDNQYVNDTPRWLLANVKPHVTGEQLPTPEVARRIVEFVGEDAYPEFWAYFADYDWVVFGQTFGRMVDLPPTFPKYCLDLKQLMLTYSITKQTPGFPRQSGAEHNALEDARWNKLVFDFILGWLRNFGYCPGGECR